MILEYHRPETLEEALRLLGREAPRTLPLGGGTTLSQMRQADFAVVDLQRLGLDTFRQEGNQFVLGATLKIAALAEASGIYPSLRELILNEFPQNQRQMATLAGEIVACDGRSALVTALLALDARLVWAPREREVSLGNYLPLRADHSAGDLLTAVHIPTQGDLLVEKVARSPVDLPQLVVAIFRWPSGRTRVALGGFGAAPVLALDGPDATGAGMAARSAYLHADDQWASGEYRSQVAAQLTGRMLRSLTNG